MVTCYPSYDMTPPLPSPAQCGAPGGPMGGPMGGAPTAASKDYSRPLHVDCSVEYELPDAAKPPAGQRSEPLLMIHPCYYRRAEAQRRTRFVNNLPRSSLSSPVGSGPGRRSKVARLTPAAVDRAAAEPSWSKPPVPAYPAPPPPSMPSCYKVAATADCSATTSSSLTASWPGPPGHGRTPGHIAPAAPSSAKLDAGAVLSDIIASTCSELNNNYMKQQPPPQQQPQPPSAQQPPPAQAQSSTSQASQASQASSQASQTSQSSRLERQLGQLGSSSYQQLPGYHPSVGTAAVDSLLSCKACQYQHAPHHPHHHHQHPASQATQVNRLYGGGLVKAVEPNPELAANPVPAKVRRCGVKRSRSSRAQQDCSAAASVASSATPSWPDAMLHGFAFESPATANVGPVGVGVGVWYQGQHHPHGHGPHAAAGPAPGATPADPLAAWGVGAMGSMGTTMGSACTAMSAMYCREREDDARVLWNSDSLLRLVPV